MKRTIFLAAMFIMVAIVTQAQTQTPRADARQGLQRARIHEGRTSGELSRREAAGLNMQQRHIRRSERRIKRDGEVTPREKARLERKQDRASRHIRRARHNQVKGEN